MSAPADEPGLRASIVTVCRRLWDRGLVAGQDGNVSARLGENRFLVTPAGFSKVDVTRDDLVIVDAAGSVVEGRHAPSSELALHLRAYARRADVMAVVHAHPPAATALALAGETLPGDILPEIAVLLGQIPLVPYGTPGTQELADKFDPFWIGHDVFLMANHGALTLGTNVRIAHQRMESLEHTAKIFVAARGLGRVNPLRSGEMDVLRALRASTSHE